MSDERPLWTPPLFGWQYPIEWHTEYQGLAHARGLPRGANIWRMQQGPWVAAFNSEYPEVLPGFRSQLAILEKHARLASVIRRFELKARAFLAALRRFEDN